MVYIRVSLFSYSLWIITIIIIHKFHCRHCPRPRPLRIFSAMFESNTKMHGADKAIHSMHMPACIHAHINIYRYTFIIRWCLVTIQKKKNIVSKLPLLYIYNKIRYSKRTEPESEWMRRVLTHMAEHTVAICTWFILCIILLSVNVTFCEYEYTHIPYDVYFGWTLWIPIGIMFAFAFVFRFELFRRWLSMTLLSPLLLLTALSHTRMMCLTREWKWNLNYDI